MTGLNVTASTMDDLWSRTIGYLLSHGQKVESRVGASLETWGATLCLDGSRVEDTSFLANPVRNLSPTYAAGETLWYLMGDRGGTWICHFAPSYGAFLNEVGEADGAYGPSIVAQLPYVVAELKARPDSRRAGL